MSGSIFRQRVYLPFTIIICGVGVVLRLRQYLFCRCLWLDEAMLALNILERDYSEFFRPETYGTKLNGIIAVQVVAPLFMSFQKSIVWIVGNSEMTLRFFPFLCGVLSLILFHQYTGYYLKTRGRLIALFLFAISNKLIYYSSELKQYSVDVFFVLLILCVTLKILRDRSFLLVSVLTILGAVSIWISHAVLIVLPVTGLVLLFSSLRKKGRIRVIAVLCMDIVWCLSMAMLYFVALRGGVHSSDMLCWHHELFIPITAGIRACGHWLIDRYLHVLINPLAWSRPGALYLAFWPTMLLLIGCVRLRKGLKGFLLWGPIVVALILSAMKKYPFGGRMILFLVPIFVVYAAAGMESLLQMVSVKSPRIRIIMSTIIIVPLLIYPVAYSAYRFIIPYDRENVREALNMIRSRWSAGDCMFVSSRAWPAYLYYGRGRWSPDEVFNDRTAAGTLNEFLSTNVFQRLWVLAIYPDSYSRDLYIDPIQKIPDMNHYASLVGSDVFLFEPEAFDK